MRINKILLIIPLFLTSCNSSSIPEYKGYWVMIRSDDKESSYKELHIKNQKLVILIDDGYIIEKDFFYENNIITNVEGDFHIGLESETTLIVTSKNGSKEFYKKINKVNNDVYYTRNSLIRKFNFYIQSINSNNKASIDSLEDYTKNAPINNLKIH